jgi:transposase-like protein
MSTSKRGRDGREQFWRRMVRQWRKSGLSVRAFCEERGLAQPSFYSWRRILAERDVQAVHFVPVRLASEPEPGRADASTSGLELVLGDCRRLRIAPGFDAATLQRLLAVLEEDRP